MAKSPFYLVKLNFKNSKAFLFSSVKSILCLSEHATLHMKQKSFQRFISIV